MEFSHVPVLPAESVRALNIKPDGVYVDGTLGGGGHSALILQNLTPQGRLIGIDRDENAVAAASERLRAYKNFLPIHGNFHDMPEILAEQNIPAVDGVLLDLGISSYQIDTPERGFSFRHDGPLDMRMDKTHSVTARDIVNECEEKRLAYIFFTYGEERNSRRIARAICEARKAASIETTVQLSAIIERTSPPYHGAGLHPATRSFMALRIAVNNELEPLEGVLRNIVPFLSPSAGESGGRFAVITFHSLEDRIVKKTFASLENPCLCPRDIPYCVCGKVQELKVITRKPIIPSPEEILLNRRAHSAKLRVAERL
ncbi:MAG: 16S rRNA (cytosine(1402)-N(4))-methyltransferase RsmH [Defluviitaleaceae bacterium]|nr:16S rRNA (cytosine(1402)-N(4))-methyltransferase RsmH [Defluviitaleaceae bacterium]